MLKLSASSAPCEIELQAGVLVRARTVTTIDVIAAETEATAMMLAGLDGQALIELVGFGFTMDGPDLTDPGVRESWTRFVIEVLLAEQTIKGWEGIGNEAGEPVDPDRASIAMLLQDPGHRAKLMTTIQKPFMALESEAKK